MKKVHHGAYRKEDSPQSTRRAQRGRPRKREKEKEKEREREREGKAKQGRNERKNLN
jgi:hypothetical protein